ncbi:programmed cell death protein 2 [Rhinophrynus dorsalis]
MAAACPVIELGFVQETESWRLRSPQFPSKVGGRPAWLGEVGVPGPEELQCNHCGKPLAFLLQVYAPCTGSFHRSIFIFCCRNAGCYQASGSHNFKVFRNQLPRKNETYSYGPPPDTGPPDGIDSISFQLTCGLRLCRVCGCLGPKICSKCHKVNYCSKEHQLIDWKVQHKKHCSEQFAMSTVAVPDHGFLFPEYELVTEPEEIEVDHGSQDGENGLGTNKDADFTGDDIETSMETSMDGLNLDEKELEAMAKHETEEDKMFNSFKKRISLEPEQVLRYCRGGEPLWISNRNVPVEEDIPNCLCGAKRIFEFQVMPQLLNHLKVDSLGESIDWGVLAIYTCADNCNAEKRYAAEFLWKQDIVGDTI